MNKHLLKTLACFGLIGTFSSIAQASNPIVDNPDNRAYISVRAALDVSVPGNFKYSGAGQSYSTDVLTSAPGITIGGYYNVPLVANLYVEPGLELYYNTTGIDVDAFGAGFDTQIEEDVFNHKSTRRFGMRVPVTLGYHFDFIRNGSMSVFVGPVLNVAFSNDYYISTAKDFIDPAHMSGSMFNGIFGATGAKMQRVGLGLRTGIGFHFLRNFYFGLSGDIGLLKMIKMTDRNREQLKVSYHENTFMLSLGYCFK